jgi:hypothetical protein
VISVDFKQTVNKMEFISSHWFTFCEQLASDPVRLCNYLLIRSLLLYTDTKLLVRNTSWSYHYMTIPWSYHYMTILMCLHASHGLFRDFADSQLHMST